jgi:hypothetical protein
MRLNGACDGFIGPNWPGAPNCSKNAPSPFTASGVTLTVCRLRSRIIVNSTSPSFFSLNTRMMSKSPFTGFPSTSTITSPAFNPAFAAGEFSRTLLISRPLPSATPK